MHNPEPLASTEVAAHQVGLVSPVPVDAYGAAFDEDGGDPAGVAIRRAFAALLRYKWLVLGIFAVSSVAAFFLRRQFSPAYEAEGKIWISVDDRAQTGPVRAGALMPSSSWGDLLTSYSVLSKTVRELHLYLRPADSRDDALFSAVDVAEHVRPGAYALHLDTTGRTYSISRIGAGADSVVERGLVGDSIGRTIGLLWRPDTMALKRARMVAFSLTTPRQAALGLGGRIRAEIPREANIMRVFVTDANAWRATIAVNSLQRHLVETADEFKRRNVTEVRKALETQLAYAADALKQADDSLESFRMQTITLPSEVGTPINGGIAVTRNPVITSYFTLKLTRESLEQERTALEQTLRDIQAGKLDVLALWQVLPTDGGTQEIGALLQEYTRREADLRNMRSAFTDQYQGVREARAALAQLRDQAIPSMVNTLIAQLKRREDDLGRQIGEQSASLQQVPPRTIEEVRLTRNADARSQLYGMLQSRYEEARLAELSVAPDLSILDSASMPTAPVSNRGRQVFLLGVLGGLAGAIVLALLLDRLDKRIRYTRQVPARLRLNVIGAVPHTQSRRKPDPLDGLPLLEAFRSLRLNVTYAAAQSWPLLVTITSTSVGEGKSLVSSNLALSFAESGYRTLLIDGDLRRGSLHSTFGADRRPGLADVLRGACGLGDALRATSHAKLMLLPSGSRLAAAPELLASPAFDRLIQQVQSNYDVILIDSPPLSAGMDPHALCVATSNVLFVVRLAQTDGDAARQKLQVLSRLPVSIVGAIVNDVKVSGGLNDEYSYHPYYASQDEEGLLPVGDVRDAP